MWAKSVCVCEGWDCGGAEWAEACLRLLYTRWDDWPGSSEDNYEDKSPSLVRPNIIHWTGAAAARPMLPWGLFRWFTYYTLPLTPHMNKWRSGLSPWSRPSPACGPACRGGQRTAQPPDGRWAAGTPLAPSVWSPALCGQRGSALEFLFRFKWHNFKQNGENPKSLCSSAQSEWILGYRQN